MPKMIFVNLPVTDVGRSVRFYEAIGCVKDERFSNERAAMMVWSDAISFMVLAHDFYATFTAKRIADAREVSEVLLCLSRDSRGEVDAIVEAAVAAGGSGDVRPAQDTGFTYGRSFEDPDGHLFEPMWMDVDAATAAMGGERETA